MGWLLGLLLFTCLTGWLMSKFYEVFSKANCEDDDFDF
jgi:hypothetical protein